jgi:hypothetical protein
MTNYEYPYADFSRDFDAILPSPNSVALDEMQRMMVVRDYIQCTYPDDVDRVERGAALALAWNYLCRHMAEFDTGNVAVRGSEHSIISEALLRAIHAVICTASLEGGNIRPDPGQVRKLAEKFIREGVK